MATKAATPSILPPSILNHPKAVAPAYAVFVLRNDGKVRRQVYLSLHSAQSALDRAAKNGTEAKCVLVELVPVPASPVYVVGGGER